MLSPLNSPICLEPDSVEDESTATAPQMESEAVFRRVPRFTPAVPRSVAETGLPASLIEQLILKILYVRGETVASDLARAVGLPFALIEEMIEWHRHRQLVEVKGSSGFGPISAVLSVTEGGRRVARDYLEVNQYTGPAPVPVNQYAASVRSQRTPPNWLSPERLAKAYTHMVVKDEILDQLGPAVNAGRSFLVYGQPGDGKTHLAQAVFNIAATPIYLPYALESQGNIIRLYDPLFHELIEAEEGSEEQFAREMTYDGRWARCRRPFIVTGGELSLAMLDLSYNAVSKVYDAPYQLKANNGSYLIDDFGRQKASPAEILNRWILPLEHRVDYLSFLNGGKMNVPFETFLIFSTNLTPKEIGDEAFLRRIQYKMLLPSPDEEEFRRIFVRFCESQSLSVAPAVLDRFIQNNYRRTCKPFRRCHPRDVVSQAIDYIRFKRLPLELSEDILDRAFASCLGATD